MTAYAYLRRSSISKDRPGDVSREIQDAAVRALAARHGDEPVMLTDWGISGRKGTDGRPGYRRLWEAIDSGDCTAIYSYSLSRLARSLPELARLFEVSLQKRIPIRLHADAVDTSTASGRLVATVLSGLAVFESDVTGERMRAMYDARRANGARISNTPTYGGKDGEDLDAVLAAFDEAGSFLGAAKALNEQGVPTRLGGLWSASSVLSIVRRHRPYMPSPGRGRRTIGAFRFARLLRCPCGQFLTGSTDSGVVRYRCGLGSMTPHQRRSLPESRLLPLIAAEAARLHTPDRLAAQAEDDAARAALEAKRERVMEMALEGVLMQGERVRLLTEVNEALAALATKATVIDVPQAIDWEGWTPEAINVVLRAIWERIDLDADLLPATYEWRAPEWRA